MTQIKFLKKNNNSAVNTDNGDIFYPVTVSNAVYVTSSKTIDEVIGESIDNKSIYQWIKLLETKSKYVLSIDNFQENYLPLINNLQNKIPQLENYLESLNNNILNISRNCSNSIYALNNKLKNFKYDSEPTKGSCNLVNSGSIYSYINKKLNTLKSINNFNQVDSLDNYVGYDGEVVLYVGETTDKYEHDRFYMYHDGIIEFDDNDLCNNNFAGTETEPYWEKISDFGFNCNCDADLANYYNKTEINELLNNISDTNTIYYGSDTINIDENNVLHAIIPTPQQVNLGNYYTKQQIDELLNNYGPKYRQGENIIIQNGVISAVLPSQQQVNLSKYYKASEVDEIINGLKDTTYTAGNNIWISENNEINAIVPNVEDFMDNYEIELSSCSPNVHIEKIEEKKEIVTTSKKRTTTTTTIENGEVTTNVEEEDIPGEDVEPISDSDFSKKVKYCIKIDSPNDGTLTIKQGDNVLGTFSANQSENKIITIPTQEQQEIPTVGNGTITIKQGETTIDSFSVNQSNNQTITIPENKTKNKNPKVSLSGKLLTLEPESSESLSIVEATPINIDSLELSLFYFQINCSNGTFDWEEGKFIIRSNGTFYKNNSYMIIQAIEFVEKKANLGFTLKSFNDQDYNYFLHTTQCTEEILLNNGIYSPQDCMCYKKMIFNCVSLIRTGYNEDGFYECVIDIALGTGIAHSGYESRNIFIKPMLSTYNIPQLQYIPTKAEFDNMTKEPDVFYFIPVEG